MNKEEGLRRGIATTGHTSHSILHERSVFGLDLLAETSPEGVNGLDEVGVFETQELSGKEPRVGSSRFSDRG